MKESRKVLATISVACASALVLVACGGGGGGDGGVPQEANTATISGMVAAGAPLNGLVTARDASGKTVTAQTNADGTYALDVSALAAPYLIYASGVAGGRAYTIASAGTAEDLKRAVNVTPLTDLIVANVAGRSGEAFLLNPDFTRLTREALDARAGELRQRLQALLAAANVPASFDFLRTPFPSDRTGFDAVLDAVEVDVDAANNVATIRNRLDTSQSIVDNLASTTDNSPLGMGAANLNAAVGVSTALRDRINSLASLVRSGTATEAQLNAYFHPEFLGTGFPSADYVAFFLDPAQRGAALEFLSRLASFSLYAFSPTAVDVAFGDDLTGRVWRFVKDGETWLIAGDHVPYLLSVHVETHQGAGGTRVSQINTGVAGGASVIGENDYFVVEGPGLPAGYVLVQKESNNPAGAATPGHFFAAHGLTEAEIGQMVDGGFYTFTRVRDVNGDTLLGPAASGAGVAVESGSGDDVVIDGFWVKLLKRPAGGADTTVAFPTITAPTAAALGQTQSGPLDVAWSLPAGSRASSLALDRRYDNGLRREAAIDLADTATSGTLSVPAPSGGVLQTQSVVLFTEDVFGRTISAELEAGM
jgi:hypothetical protein